MNVTGNGGDVKYTGGLLKRKIGGANQHIGAMEVITPLGAVPRERQGL